MLNVLLTIDTELWPRADSPTPSQVRLAMQRDIYGLTPRGEYGIRYQMDVLSRHGLKANFMVESLFASATGPEPLGEIVSTIQQGGQDVQLHLHPEWLRRFSDPALPAFAGPGMKDYSCADQQKLIERALHNLRAAGADQVTAFRAGGYGANFDTLTALSRAGIAFDTSQNTPWLGVTCDLWTKAPFLQPEVVNDVCEFPVSYFEDWPGHFRHAQLCACSSAEMENCLVAAHRQGWFSFVIVAHSFEMIRRARQLGGLSSVDRIVVKRFERLCRFLTDNHDKFRTVGFGDLQPKWIPAIEEPQTLRSSVFRTAGRIMQQASGRLFH